MREGPVNRQTSAFRPKKDLTDADLTAIASAAPSDSARDSVTGGEGGWVDHAMLKAFLAYNSTARFTSSYDMYRFLSALLASSRTSAVWTAHDASDILAEIAPAKPGIARLAEIVNKPFSTTAGSSPSKLSFQRGFLVLAMYLTSAVVKNSHLVLNVNAMYVVLHANPAWIPATIGCIKELVARKKVAEPEARVAGASFEPDNFLQVFLPLAQLLHEYLSRFNDAIVKCPQVDELMSTLIDCFDQYSDDLLSPDPTFRDPLSAQDISRRQFALDNVKRYLSILPRIAQRTQARPFPQAAVTTSLGQTLPPGVLSMLFKFMQMPGELRPEGPRHDNDFSDFRDIAILPTHAELTCTAPPFVPANLPEAPHHLEGMDRQLDILFRLMREDFVGRRRAAPTGLGEDGRQQRLDRLAFAGLSIDRHELELQLHLRLPSGWKNSNMVIGHLSAGNLVGLVTFGKTDQTGRGSRARADIRVSLGVVAADLEGSRVKVSFLETTDRDQTIYLDALHQLACDEKARLGGVPLQKPTMYLFELPGFLLSTVEPFLLALKHLSPPSVPFADILSAKPSADRMKIAVQPPLYARNPGFAFDLSCLLEDDAAPGTLTLQVTDAQSVANAKEILAQPGASKLDATQAQAMVDCLCREVALVEGPPGTGKSWLGVELVRVLLKAKVGRILVLAFTNHALDETLKHLIEKSVTINIVRCGSRSQEEELQNLHDRPGGFSRGEKGRAVRERRELETEIKRACALVSEGKGRLDFDQAQDELYNLGLMPHLERVPPAVVAQSLELQKDDWMLAGKKAAVFKLPQGRPETYNFWRKGGDLDVRLHYEKQRRFEGEQRFEQHRLAAKTTGSAAYANRLAALAAEKGGSDTAVADGGEGIDPFFEFEEEWVEPTTRRPVDQLIADGHVWDFSRWERAQVIQHIAETLIRSEGSQLARLQLRLKEINEKIASYNNEEKLDVLKSADVIGATTNGAANILDIISKVRPSVVLVEEAGECLEVHVVANLVESVQHLLLIGDHKQLRPQITSFGLSIDSKRGELHRHDVSLFERLAQLRVPMSILQTQRRMRPDISKLVGNFLYPDLENAPSVKVYPDVKGMKRNVFFVDHALKEDKASALHSSRTNTGEAQWVVDLVRHLLLQGGVQAKSIAVLTPYLGQVKVLREALMEQKVTVILDERDIGDLEAEGGELDEGPTAFAPKAREEQLSSRVILRTVDRFQGEEADIVILSLVRNVGTSGDDEGAAIFSRDMKASIGFLKSPNRTNVALSRAKIGLFIFGSAGLLRSKAPMWESVVHDLEQDNAVGPLLPVSCANHPEKDLVVGGPGILPQLAPFGGCQASCDASLPCGHLCPRPCHPMDREVSPFRSHRNDSEGRDELKLVLRQHKFKKCAKIEPHPACQFSISSVDLPRGHSVKNIACSLAQNAPSIVCKLKVTKKLPCGYHALLDCATNPQQHPCEELCGAALNCVHKTCSGRCSDCSSLKARGDEFGHVPHAHGKMRLCGHECVGNCFEHVKAGACPPICEALCTRTCAHSSCKSTKNEHMCSQPCPSCLHPCDTPGWEIPCAVPDSLLPANIVCDKKLKCGCPCPSLRDEPCARQICPKHASSSAKGQVVDPFLMTTLGEYKRDDADALTSLITLDCGVFQFDQFYEKDESKLVYTALKYPSEDKARPVCPTCKHIVSTGATVRYRRAIKFGELCLQERLRTGQATVELEQVTANFEQLDLPSVLELITSDAVDAAAETLRLRSDAADKRQIELTKREFIITPFVFDAAVTIGFEGLLLKQWRKASRAILRLYEAAARIVLHRSPHTQAYDAAVTKLFAEVKTRLLDSDKPYANVDEVALRMAKRQVGIVPLTTDDRLALKGTWLTLEARFLLLDIARALLAALKANDDEKQAIWAVYDLGIFILRTAERDIAHALERAEETTSRRLSFEGYLYRLRVAYESSRFACQTGVRYGMIERELAVEPAAAKERQAAREFERAVQAALAAQPSLAALLEDDVRPKARSILDDWVELIEKTRRGETFYEEVSTQERIMIVKAMSFGTTGHFYKCPNGHTFVIGECGGAVETSSCPECGAAIGGGGHRLIDTNRNDLEMDRLAVEEAGARREYLWGVRE
ncbi:hypothetical protein JCM10296v2_002789 [Rhodotorula toruloides]